MRVMFRSISSHDMLAVAALGGGVVCRQVEHELDLRATNALVSRILKEAKRADGPAGRRSAESPVAA
ncbi:MAG: hypothetical protein AMK72_03685 [Planctomycetes bacterium SM23_25]|nr:MAG: hypothetical protein AMS14_04780 [Planctomycetes bacterium DG_20]KPK49758.1 MAG: hypothetical protein AMK72_03685 [Planctomycetes bacterium SM23_25]